MGWEALRTLWNIGPEHFSQRLLWQLSEHSSIEQQQILLTLAASDVSKTPNLTAALRALMKQPHPLCWMSLAGLCPHAGPGEGSCGYRHLQGSRGWDLLHSRWGITYRHLDCAALSLLATKPVDEQERLLCSLADVDLDQLQNLSAFLQQMIRFSNPQCQ